MTGLATRPRDAGVPAVSPSPALRRIVLLDPGLFFEGGHHASFARLLDAEVARRGAGMTIVGARRIDHPPAGLDIVRHFRTSPYAPLPAWGPLPALRACNDEVCEDACALPARLVADADVVIVPTITARNALGFARWLARRPADATPVAMVLMFPPGGAGDDTLRAAERSIYRQAMDVLAGAAGRVALFAETAPLAALFTRLGARVVHPLPWPVALTPAATPRLPFDPRRMPPHVAHLGYSKMETGIGLLPAVISAVAAADAAVRFTVQANAWNAPAVDRCVQEIATLAPVARVVHGALSPGAYADAMREADIVLLPYDPRGYRDRGSGVFVEAAASGRIVVIPAGTWMADRAAAWNLAAVTFDRFDAASVADAVIRAVGDRVTLLERAAAAAPAWRDEHRPSRFLARVLEALPASPPARPVVRVTPAADDDFLDEGLWTPQTQMLRSIRDWVLACDDEPVRALSIDRNPTLDDILVRRWPHLDIARARYPTHDVQDLAAFDHGTFDLVYSHQVLEHVPRPWRAAAELVRVLRPGGLGLHTTCAYNPRHGYPAFKDFYRFLPDGLEQLFDGVEVLVRAGWGNRQALLHNLAIDDGHGVLGGRRFGPAVGEPNDDDHPWHTWIIFRRC